MNEEKSSQKLELRLLGSPEVLLAGQAVTGFRSGKVRALLYYLAVTERAQPRSVLAGMFWGDVAESHARRSLTMTLSNLRRLVGCHLVISRETVTFDVKSDYWLDVAAFEVGLNGAPNTLTVEELQQIISLYRGDFLDGFYIHEAPEFEQWTLVERVRLRDRVLQALHTLADQWESRGDLPQAIAAMRRLLKLGPWREEAHRQLMWLLARDGQRSVALAQYETCLQMLDQELGVKPDQQTVALYEQIKAGEIERQAQNLAVSPLSRASIPAISGPLAFQHNLPPQPTPFIGRKKELADIIRRLTDRDCRLLTLIGPGGIGKTRLALQTAQRLIDADSEEDFFEHGVLFVPLAAVESSDGIVSAIAETAKFTFYSDVPPKQQLLDYFREKAMLLILDNLEHLLQPAEKTTALIAGILAAAPKIKLLVTSRQALNLQEAWFHPVEGLSVPPSPAERSHNMGGAGLEQYDAVQLFVQMAQRTRVEFSLAAEQPHIIEICRLVEGMPLAIELAAAWLKALPAAEIVAEIKRDLDILTARHQNVPARHRSMRVVLAQSWQWLTKSEQEMFKRLSVFRGGFAAEAAGLVTGASLIDLATFVDKSLLSVTLAGRYQIHELLRQYAAEQLARSPQAVTETHDKHCVYYADFLHQRAKGLLGGRQRLNLAEIMAEYDNVWAAWRWAIREGRVAQINKSASALQGLCQFQGKYLEGAMAWEAAVDLLSAIDPTEQVNLTLVEVLIWWGWLLIRLGRLDKAETALMTCRDLYRRLGIPPVPGYGTDPALPLSLIATIRGDYDTAVQYGEQARQQGKAHNHPHNLCEAHYVLASATLGQGNYQAAQRHAQRALVLARQADDRWFIAYCLNELGKIALALGNLTAAQEHFEASYAIRQEFNDPQGMGVALNHLGEIALRQQNYVRAQALYQESLAIYQNISDKGGLATAHKGLGAVASDQRNFQAAQQHLQYALQLAVEIDYVPLIFSTLNIIGAFWLKIERLERGLMLLAFVREHASRHRPAQAEAQQRLDGYRSGTQKDMAELLGTVQGRVRNRTLEDIVGEVMGDLYTSP